jgi:diphthamide biosynthesis methyltransferase
MDREGILSADAHFVVFSRLGDSSEIFHGTLDSISSAKPSGPAVIIICGELHFTERDYLEAFGTAL